MTSPPAKLAASGRPIDRDLLLLTALSVVFGSQCLRVLLPSIIWYLEEVLGYSVQQGVLVWVAPFLLAAAFSLAARWLKPKGAFVAAGGALLTCRLVMEQAWTAQVINIWSAAVGVAAFIGLLMLLHARALAEAQDGAWPFVAGLLLGLGLDSALRGLNGTVDLVWSRVAWATGADLALFGLFGFLLWRSTRGAMRLAAPSLAAGVPLLGLGFYLFIQWVVLQSQGWVTEFSGWPPAAALAWLLLGDVGAVLAAAGAFAGPPASRLLTLAASVVLIGALALDQSAGWGSAMAILIGLVCAGWLLACLAGAGQRQPPAALDRPGLAVWLGLSVFALLIVVYSISFVVQLPFPNSALEPVAGAGLAVCALAAAWLWPTQPHSQPAWRAPAGLGAALLLAPLLVLVTGSRPAPPAPGFPLRVLTYNIRDGFGMNGRQDLEAIAQVIEGSGAQLVALQEVGRGSLLESGADVLGELSQRLNMPYVVMETATAPTFGDAILSRFPIRIGGQASLPRLTALIGRGYGWAQIDVGDGAPLFVVTSHLDSGEGARGSAERTAEVNGLAAAWAARPRVLILGDMNSQAGSPEMQAMQLAGLVDTWAEAGQGQRPAIDWIFHTPDLRASNAYMIDSQASDHLAVTATIDVRP